MLIMLRRVLGSNPTKSEKSLAENGPVAMAVDYNLNSDGGDSQNLNLNGSWRSIWPAKTLQLQVNKQENKGDELAHFMLKLKLAPLILLSWIKRNDMV